MRFWGCGDTLVVRNIARSDNTVSTAVPTITIQDEFICPTAPTPFGSTLTKMARLSHGMATLRLHLFALKLESIRVTLRLML